ncbi:AMP-binding protein [Vasconcelosia minhoensis]|nr:AMP-binding protein [Romeria gracilis]
MAAALMPADSSPVELWQRRRWTPWLLDSQPAVLATAVAARRRQLQALQQIHPRPRIVLAESDPVQFLAGFLAACLAGCDVALGNPDWGQREWRQVQSKISPHLCWGGPELPELPDLTVLPAVDAFAPQPPADRTAVILIPTGGTAGSVRFVVHRWQTLLAAVRGFCDGFGQPVNAYCVLPLHHVSGLMQALRTWISGGQLVTQPFRSLVTGQILVPSPQDWTISLVPTQLQRLLSQERLARWLAQFRTVLLGGGPAWPDLLAAARGRKIPLALTYGMTETAALVAALMPDEFLRGQTGGSSLPHAQLRIVGPAGDLPPGEIGPIAIQTSSLAEGYYGEPSPAFTEAGCFYPDDLGYLDAAGGLHIVGRDSDKIITGGENVFPAEVEAALRATRQVADVCVIGLPDPQWGQVVTAVYVPDSDCSEDLPTALKAALVGQLSRYKHPKRWVAVAALPRSPQGKLSRPAVLKLAQHSAAASPAAPS